MSLSLDLDNLWSYLKTHGDPGWESFPSYLDDVTQTIVGTMTDLGLPLTVFVVGQDAALERNHCALRRLATAGFELGNHSFHHEPWLHLYSADELEDDIAKAEAAIEAATGARPVGFRGPGYSSSPATLAMLCRRGYEYDCSSLPTYLGPLARLYYLWSSRGLSSDERRQRDRLFGTWRDGLAPVRPYQWVVDGTAIIEIPVTTTPILRLPMHMSYVLYLASHSPALGRAYLRASATACRWARIEPSFLLHPLDFIGQDVAPDLAFFPGMRLPSRVKQAIVRESLQWLSEQFTVVTVRDHARSVGGRLGQRA
jgi:peptidoglycan/xylan/chitin deacetylase (PgdA/CDA1 family)